MSNRFRQQFIALSMQLNSMELAKSLCNTVDVALAVSASVYGLSDTVERMKQKSQHEVDRIKHFFKLVLIDAPAVLLSTYIAHQKWKEVVFNLSLGREVDLKFFASSHTECELAKWLDSGGRESIPEQKLNKFLAEHEKVHFLGASAINEAKNGHPERIVEFLAEMEIASDYVSQVILDLIEEDLIRLATNDALTALPNRRAFDLEFKKQSAFAKRNKLWLGLIVIDIDYFKKVNDRYGHAVGDEILKQISDLLKVYSRAEEQVFRWGGEEFTIITLAKKQSEGLLLAERFRRNVEKHDFKTVKGIIPLTVSCGVVSVHHDVKLFPEDIFPIADSQLYSAKEGGRNRVEYVVLSE